MFDPKSRYRHAATYPVTAPDGRTINVVEVPEPPRQSLAGVHLRREGERIDHLAAAYLDDAAGYWRVCEINDVMLPEALTEAREIRIPDKNR